jgi:hypothetical protein
MSTIFLSEIQKIVYLSLKNYYNDCAVLTQWGKYPNKFLTSANLIDGSTAPVNVQADKLKISEAYDQTLTTHRYHIFYLVEQVSRLSTKSKNPTYSYMLTLRFVDTGTKDDINYSPDAESKVVEMFELLSQETNDGFNTAYLYNAQTILHTAQKTGNFYDFNHIDKRSMKSYQSFEDSQNILDTAMFIDITVNEAKTYKLHI